MSKLIFAAFCAVLVLPALALPAVAAEQGSIVDMANMPDSERAAQNSGQTAGQTPADVDMANVRSAQAASGVPATAAKPAEPQPAGQGAPAGEGQPAAQQPATEGAEPKSSIPLDKRQGGDITQCLEAGDKSDQAIAACADKYRPRGRGR